MAKAEMVLTRQELFDAQFDYVRKNYGVKGEIQANIRVEYNSIRDVKVKYDVPKIREENPFFPKSGS